MGEIDSVTKEYMSEPHYFADAFNYYLFSGRQVIKAEDLREVDTTEVINIFKEQDFEALQKNRDILKSCVMKEDGNARYLLLGIENQSEVHYAMPVRVMLYDAMSYAKQVSFISRGKRKEKTLDSKTFLSGISREDKIKPVITLTIYFGIDEWDGPRALSDMFEGSKNGLPPFINDYKLNLIVPREITDFKAFATDLGKAMQFLSVAQDKAKVKTLYNEEFSEVSADTVHLLNVCTGSKFKIKKGQKVIDMHTGLDDLLQEREDIGIDKGVAIGIDKGVAIGVVESISKLLQNGVSEEQLLIYGFTKEEIEGARKSLQKLNAF